MASKKPSPAALTAGVLFFCWVLYVVVGFNGSSLALWCGILKDPSTQDSLLAGTPRPIRSDEWLVWTPAIIAQGNHQPAWPVSNPALGAGNSPLIMSLPAWHSSMLVRPQLWGFFIFGLERGFSWYWGAKIFGLLGGMFALLWWLTKGRWALAAGGSLWVFLSSYVQWYFSCPPMLPEMLGSWGFTLASLFLLSTTQCWKIRALAAVGCAIASANFILCCYPPFQIPLIYLGLAIFIAWRWEMPAAALASRRTFWMGAGVAMLLFLAVMGKWYADVAETLRMVANTSYPGAREIAGGSLQISRLFSGIINFGMSELDYPQGAGNVSLCSNFTPLWLVSGLVSLPVFFKKRTGLLPVLIMGLILFLCVYCIVGLPGWLAKLTLLGRSTELRCILPIGIGCIVFTIVALSRIQRDEIGKYWKWIAGATGSVLVILILRYFWSTDPEYFTPSRWMILILCNGSLVVLLAMWRERLFLAAVILSLTPWALSVNPLNTGLAPLTEAAPLPALRKLAATNPDALWIAYSSSHLSSFLVAAGLPVLSGSKTVPDMGFYQLLDPAKKFQSIYNRYSITIFELPRVLNEFRFELINFCSHRIVITPQHPVLRKLNVDFFVLSSPLPLPAKYGLTPALLLPQNGICVYRPIPENGSATP